MPVALRRSTRRAVHESEQNKQEESEAKMRACSKTTKPHTNADIGDHVIERTTRTGRSKKAKTVDNHAGAEANGASASPNPTEAPFAHDQNPPSVNEDVSEHASASLMALSSSTVSQDPKDHPDDQPSNDRTGTSTPKTPDMSILQELPSAISPTLPPFFASKRKRRSKHDVYSDEEDEDEEEGDASSPLQMVPPMSANSFIPAPTEPFFSRSLFKERSIYTLKHAYEGIAGVSAAKRRKLAAANQAVNGLLSSVLSVPSVTSHPQEALSTSQERYPTRLFPPDTPTDVLVAMNAALGGDFTKSIHQVSQEPDRPMSRLSREDHLRLMQLEELFRTNASLLSDSDRTTREYLLGLLAQEQDHYRRWQKQRIKQSGKLEHVDGAVKQVVEAYFTRAQERVKTLYRRYYVHSQALSISFTPASKSDPILTHKATLHKAGKLHKVTLPNLTVPLPIDFKSIVNDNPEHYLSIPESLESDPYFKTVPLAPNVDIITAPDALGAIIDLQSSPDNAWEIPVMVKTEGNAQRVYIQAPLPSKSMTIRDINQLFFDATMHQLCIDKIEDGVPLEQLGQTKDTEPTSNDRSGVIGRIDSPTYSPATPNLDYEQNFTYTIWEFGDLVLLIRYNIDAYAKEATDTSRLVCLRAKLEYHCDENMREEITDQERARWWLQSYLRGHAHVLLGHINVLKHAVIGVERKTMIDIFNNNRWNPMQHSKMLYHILLVPGDYLLMHKKGEWNVHVLKSVDQPTASSYDLHEAHQCLPAQEEATQVLIPWSGPHDQFPYTFPPRTHGEQKPCYQFAATGVCTRENCPYSHHKPATDKKKKAPANKKRKKHPQPPPNIPLQDFDRDENEKGSTDFDALIHAHKP
ncbi:hypothetical protein BZG36_04998 [Bifiguratus adelaidae]|uniref:C3H1-type domain-containing protein n=1 Tax=Bifiguratus adelaidae TaxID=1938954 RepID=A0A261XUU0_9FUNG|nr:hypothetical protein BZG36_04998 [Bifiguratus adelaidae]